MTSRERVLAAMQRKTPDKVPKDMSWGMTPGAIETFHKHVGAGQEPEDYFQIDTRLNDFILPPADPDRYMQYYAEYEGNENFSLNEWGVGQLKSTKTNFHFVQTISPLRNAETLEDIESFPLADLMNQACYAHLKQDIPQLHERGLAAIGPTDLTIFELAWQIRGYEEFMTDMLVEPEMAECLLSRIFELRLKQALKLEELGLDVLTAGDDVCVQRGLLISVDLFNQFLKPKYDVMIRTLKQRRNIPIFYHTDGKNDEILHELIDVGVDILNPCQPECNDLAAFKRQYGDRLSFWGCVGTQSVLPFYTPDQIRTEVKRLIETVGQGGGLLLGPTHYIEPEVPWENVVALYEAIEEYGTYQ